MMEQQTGDSIGIVLQNMQSLVYQYKDEVNALREKYVDSDVYTEAIKSNDLVRTYGYTVDDLGRAGGILASLATMSVDMRDVRRALNRGEFPHSVMATYTKFCDRLRQNMEDVKYGAMDMRGVLEARVKYLHSCQYLLADKIYGDRS